MCYSRVLSIQTLFFGRGYKEKVNPSADWGRAATSKAMLTGVNVREWILIFPQKDSAVAQTFFKEYQRQGKNLGVEIHQPDIIGKE